MLNQQDYYFAEQSSLPYVPPGHLTLLFFCLETDTLQLHTKLPPRKPAVAAAAAAHVAFPLAAAILLLARISRRARAEGARGGVAAAAAVLGARVQRPRVLDVQQPPATPAREVRGGGQGGVSGVRGGVYAVDGEEYSCCAGEV